MNHINCVECGRTHLATKCDAMSELRKKYQALLESGAIKFVEAGTPLHKALVEGALGQASNEEQLELFDPVSKPKHYNSHPSGIECIQVTEHFNFNLGNAIKYIWRAGLKSDNAAQDLEKAAWYVQREIIKIKNQENANVQK